MNELLKLAIDAHGGLYRWLFVSTNFLGANALYITIASVTIMLQ